MVDNPTTWADAAVQIVAIVGPFVGIALMLWALGRSDRS